MWFSPRNGAGLPVEEVLARGLIEIQWSRSYAMMDTILLKENWWLPGKTRKNGLDDDEIVCWRLKGLGTGDGSTHFGYLGGGERAIVRVLSDSDETCCRMC